MTLQEAMQEYGCAIYRNGEVVHLVEHYHDTYVLHTVRRGVCLLSCDITTIDHEHFMRMYEGVQWIPARHLFMAKTGPNTLESVSL